jgi:hypothetical protein
MTERDWDMLLGRIKDGKCMPFLGAGASYGALPLGAEIAREWAKEYGYPFEDSGDLVRVAQYVAVQQDASYPKEAILHRFAAAAPPNFKEPDEPHGLLADLGLPVYLTTNYDDFMVRALKGRSIPAEPRRETCRWNERAREIPSAFDDPKYQPTPANPVVFHLHGHSDPDTLVLTEDDYLCFLAQMAGKPDLLPGPVKAALATSSLLFLGYRLADWNFRVLLQGLRPEELRRSVVVMVPPGGPEGTREKAQEYLEQYYAAMKLRIYWGTARAFCGELRQRWDESKKTA